jgi:hypothetical protein
MKNGQSIHDVAFALAFLGCLSAVYFAHAVYVKRHNPLYWLAVAGFFYVSSKLKRTLAKLLILLARCLILLARCIEFSGECMQAFCKFLSVHKNK